MARGLFGAKPLPQTMPINYQLDPQGIYFNDILFENQTFH